MKCVWRKKKKLGIAFKALKYIESSSEDDDDKEKEIEEVKYITKNFKGSSTKKEK